MLPTLKTLLFIYPPSGLVLIGAGNGGSDIVRFLIEHSILNVVLIESSLEQHQHLKEFIYSNKNFEPKDWCFLNEVVSKKKEKVTYFVCNKSAEDGLINPELLTNIWPNLKLKYTETLESISLNATYELLNAAPNWLVINCLAAGLIIDFQQDLKNIDVLILRVLINDNEIDSVLEHSDFKTLKKYLEDSGFKTISTYQSNHPQIANAVFVRDYKMSVIEQTTALQEKDELINTLNAQRSVCEKALSEAKQLAADTEQQLKETIQSHQQLIQEKDELINTLNAQHSVCEKALSEAKQHAADVEQQLKETVQSHQQLIQEKDELINTLNAQHSVCEKALSEEKSKTNDAKKLIESNNQATLKSNKQYISIAHKYAIAKLQLQKLTHRNGDNSLLPKPLKLDLKIISILDMGDAWSSNTVNTVIFRAHAILTKNNIQYTAFYFDQKTLRVIKRDLITNEIQTHDIKGVYNLYDAHNSISLGIDKLDYLHISYDHHATTLQYRKSNSPQCISDWSENMVMSGKFEEKVTYPTFITPTEVTPLMLLYRDGTHNNGTARLKVYSEKSKTWSDISTPILNGMEQKPWTSNAYWNSSCLDDQGCLHLSYVWRTGVIGTDERVNNINMGYAWSPDLGNSWFTINSQPYIPPITPSISETIWPTGAGSNLINQCSMALDSYQHPHIVFYSNDQNQIPQYQHLWFDGNAWQHQYISKRTIKFNLTGGGTLQLPMSRPEIIIDENNNVMVIFQSDETDHYMSLLCLQAPDYTYDTDNIHRISKSPVGYAEPIIDKLRWQQDKVLSMLIQYNHQPNHDVGHIEATSPISIMDIKFQYKS